MKIDILEKWLDHKRKQILNYHEVYFEQLVEFLVPHFFSSREEMIENCSQILNPTYYSVEFEEFEKIKILVEFKNTNYLFIKENSKRDWTFRKLYPSEMSLYK